MSYSISLTDPETGKTLTADDVHHAVGATVVIGGTRFMELDVTYNYAEHYRRTIDSEKGIRAIYGLTGADSLPILDRAIGQLEDDVDQNYWAPTEGNARAALIHLKMFAQLRPDGVWDGD